MKVGIDCRLVRYRRGMGNYVYNLLRALAALPTAHEFVLYMDSQAAASSTPNRAGFRCRVLGTSTYPVWEQVVLPAAALADRLDLLHCPANTGPLLLPEFTRLACTVHDVMYMFPSSLLPASASCYHRLGRQYRRFIVPRVMRRARIIITDSECSRRDIQKWLGVPQQRVRMIPVAPNSACRVISDDTELAECCSKLAVTSPFILALAATDPRKNTAGVLRSYARLRDMGRVPHQLVLAGLPPAGMSEFSTQAQRLGVAEHVRLLGFVSEEDLVHLYNAASVFVYPSLYEGFGLPVLEAMACGTPVITSQRGSLAEVAGDAAVFVEPQDDLAVARAIANVLGNEHIGILLSSKGLQRVKTFDWRRTAVETLQAYEEALSQP